MTYGVAINAGKHQIGRPLVLRRGIFVACGSIFVNVQPFFSLFPTYAACKADDWASAIEIFNEMKVSKYREIALVWTDTTGEEKRYGCRCVFFLTHSSLSPSLFFVCAQVDGVRPSPGCYGSAINALGRAGKIEEAFALFR